jgi:ribonuclease HI
MTYNSNAIYVNCDGSMDYDSKSTGGVGYVLRFPDSAELDDISESIGRYEQANIVRLEMEGIIQGMTAVIDAYSSYPEKLGNVNAITIITDRYDLNDKESTNVNRLDSWRKQKWKNHEGIPIKNHDLLDRIDKLRKKLAGIAHCRVEIIFKPRKQNKSADKLAKRGKKSTIPNTSIGIKGTKVGKKIFDGVEIDYSKLEAKEKLKIHVYKKDPVQDEWSISAEVVDGEHRGKKIKIYADDVVTKELQRHHMYLIRVKEVLNYCIRTYKPDYEYKNTKKYKTI